jgi:hypothetical protein
VIDYYAYYSCAKALNTALAHVSVRYRTGEEEGMK